MLSLCKRTPGFIASLSDTSAGLSQVGGKGASLARLAAAGLPVPPGFHITTAAYRRFVAEHGLQEQILEAASAAACEQSATLKEASSRIAALFAQRAIPDDVADEIRRAYAGLGEGDVPVAVRSSATAEDLPGASFAGQQETYLNIQSVEAVLAAVHKCWLSLWTERTIAYRLRQGIPSESVSLAVVVQRLVPAEAAGILFTANPMNGRRDEMVINAAWGLGEAIVGGRVNPDTIIADKATGQIKQIEVADKTVLTVRTAQGTAEQPVEGSKRNERVLDDALVADLVALGRRIEGLCGAPQDIEWALTPSSALRAGPNPSPAGRAEIHVLQARPITTLFPLPTPLPPPEDGLRIYLCENVALQGITEPFTPMGGEIFRLMFAGMMDGVTGKLSDAYPAWVKQAAGRVYVDVTHLLNTKVGEYLAGLEAVKDPIAIGTLLQIGKARAGDIQSKRKLKLPWPMFFTVIPNLLGPIIFGYLAPRAARKKMQTMGDARLAPLKERARQLASNAGRLCFVEEATRRLSWMPFYELAYCISGLRSVRAIPALLGKWLGANTLAQPVLLALPHNPTTEMGQELLRIARAMQTEHVAPTPDHPSVQAFLQRFGHRAVREIDIGLPRWNEDPTYILEMLAIYVTQDNLEAKLEQFRTAQAEAEAAIPRVVAEVRRRKSGLHAWIIGHLLRCLREVGGMRELPKFDMVRHFAVFRRVLLKVGHELVTQGQLDQAEDVFYLTFADIRKGGDLRPHAAEARADYQREVKRVAVPRVMTSTGECFYGAPASQDGNTLVGVPVSPGVYEGAARIVDTPVGAQLEHGEILVTHSTDPSWTPLFLNAGAVIMETGGPISHGAIVAREYGIPAVVGVPEATSRLHTGQRLRVNGEAGEITCLA